MMTVTAMAADAVSDDLNYEIWAPIVKTTLVEKGLWDVVENGIPPDPSKIRGLASTIQAEDLYKWRDLAVKDMKALQILQSSLTDSAFRKTLSASSAKDVWDLLQKGNELSRLEKQFEELSMDKGEVVDSYLDRVTKIVEKLRGLKNARPDYEVIMKVLGSLPRSYDRVTPLMDSFIDLKNASLYEFVEFFGMFVSLPEIAIRLMPKDTFDSPKWGQISGDVCNKNNQTQEERYSIPRNSSGAKGHCARDRKNQQPAATKAQKYQIVADHELYAIIVGDFTYDDDMWMIHTTSSSHMTPYVRFFTTLDRTHRARVKLPNGSIIMAEGRGDVKIMTNEGKKTIKNVLFVPQINRNVLSVTQMTSIGYSVLMAGVGGFKYTIKDQNGRLFGESMWDKRGFFLRFQVIEGYLTT